MSIKIELCPHCGNYHLLNHKADSNKKYCDMCEIPLSEKDYEITVYTEEEYNSMMNRWDKVTSSFFNKLEHAEEELQEVVRRERAIFLQEIKDYFISQSHYKQWLNGEMTVYFYAHQVFGYLNDPDRMCRSDKE